MGQRGPHKTPTALKVLTGAKGIGDGEPVPATGEVVCPSNLTADAQAVWARLAPDLIAKHVLTPWDVDEFAAFCDAVARRDQASDKLDTEGHVVEVEVFDRNGKPTGKRVQLSPWWQIWKGTNEVVLRIGGRFGLTPSDRAGLKVPNVGQGAGSTERFFGS